MKVYEIIITGDTNDGDYVSETSTITEEKLNLILPIIGLIKKYTIDNPHKNNFPASEYNREGDPTVYDIYGHLEAYPLFCDMCPYGEYGIHSIDSITISEPVTRTELL